MAFLLFVLVVLLAVSSVDRLFERLGLKEDALTVGVFSMSLGLGTFASGLWLYGLAGFFGNLLILVVVTWLALRILVSPRGISLYSSNLAAMVSWLRWLPSWRPDAATIILTLVIAAFALLTLTGALAPPTSNEWDALAYHLAVPKVWLQSGRIHPIPYDHHVNFPMLAEMLYAIGLESGSTALAKSFHWLYGLLGALTCYWAGRRWVSRKAGLLAAALFLAAPIVAWEMTTAYLDLTATVYVTLAVFAFLLWREHKAAGKGDGWLWIAGVLAGFASGTKYTMIATSGLLVLWCAWLALRKENGTTWKHVGILTGLALLIGGPWYVKTWLWTGNPVYPFAYGILGGRWWSDQAALDYVAEQARFGIGKSLFAFIVAPWTTVFQAQYYANPPSVYNGNLTAAPVSPFPAVFGSLGLGALGLLPFSLWTRSRNASVRGAVLYSGVVFLVWFGMTHQTRYLIPILPLLLTAGVWGLREWARGSVARKAGAVAFSAVALMFGIVPLVVLVGPVAGVAWGQESTDSYLTRMEPLYGLSQRINRELPEDARILMLQETRGYWIDRPYAWGNPSQNGLIAWDSFEGSEEMASWLRDTEGPMKGMTHILVNWAMTSPGADKEHWPALIRAAAARGILEPVFSTGGSANQGIVVYRIVEGRPAGG